MTAIEALCAIFGAGGKVSPGPERPRLLAPPSMRPLVEEHREGLLKLVRDHGHCTPEVFRRAQVFEQQILLWIASGRFAVPVLVLRGASPVTAGSCISCGTAIRTGVRCIGCLDAIGVALGATPEDAWT